MADSELTLQEKREAIEAALEKLPPDQKEIIQRMASELVAAVKSDHPLAQFTLDGAKEIIAAIGIWLIGGTK